MEHLWKLLFFSAIHVFSSNCSHLHSEPLEPVENQLLDYARAHPKGDIWTTSYGAPVSHPTNSLTAGPHGPTLLQDTTLFDLLQSFNRERIPERVVHAKGAGAFGYFEVTNDITMYSCAQVFSQIGLRTEVAARFSQVGGESGSADTTRDVRGFSVKFHTGEGIWDLVGNNLPVFFIRDAILFPQLIHSQKRNPQTHLLDSNMYWDFASRRPEMTHLIMYVNTGFGIPLSYRKMNGYGIHSFRLVNRSGHVVYAKFHWRPWQGVANLTSEEGERLAGSQPDFLIQDLYNAIAKGDFPRWNLSIQVMSIEAAHHYRYNPFDATKEWPEVEFPLIPVGTLVLNRNPENYFVEIEQLAFNPGRLVPGIEPSPDKLLQGRLIAYSDTQTYRLGSNNQLLKVNRPNNKVSNYERDGYARPDNNQGNAPNYYPNSFNGPEPSPRGKITSYPVHGDIARYDTSDEDNFSQPRLLWNKLNFTERQQLLDNLETSLSRTYPFIQQRVLENFYQVSDDFASRLGIRLGISIH